MCEELSGFPAKCTCYFFGAYVLLIPKLDNRQSEILRFCGFLLEYESSMCKELFRFPAKGFCYFFDYVLSAK